MNNQTTLTSTCQHCGKEIEFRKNKTFCGDTCRKAAKRAAEKSVSSNIPNKTDLQRYAKVNSDAYFFADHYYNIPSCDREAYIIQIISAAYTSKVTRDTLTSPHLVKPKLDRVRMFRNKDPQNYMTFAEVANRYLRIHHQTDIYKAMKSKPDLEHKGVDMTKIDHRFNYKESECKPLTESEIDEQMQGRKQWIIDYYKQLMKAGSHLRNG